MSLGRGLGALIVPTNGRKQTILRTGDGAASTNKVWTVPVSEIFANPKQPRQEFREAELKELAASIREHGILQPLLVAEKENGGYELIAGERRLRASKIAGLSTVPVLVKAAADEQKLELALIENIQRQDLNPVEEAFAFKRLIEEFGLTQQQVADKVGKSRPAIANAVRLLELPQAIQAALADGRINTGQARALLTLDSEKQKLDMLASMLGQKISVREIERESNKLSGGKHSRRDPNLTYLEDKLRKAFGTKVSISQKGGRGSIVINYYSSEDLSRLIKRLISE